MTRWWPRGEADTRGVESGHGGTRKRETGKSVPLADPQAGYQSRRRTWPDMPPDPPGGYNRPGRFGIIGHLIRNLTRRR